MSHHFKRVRGWVGAGMAEAAGRLIVLSATTAVLARLLSPGDFGVSALTLSIVTIFAVFVGTPYEETLAQRRVIRRRHLEAALGASLAAALGLVVLSVGIGWAMDRLYDHQGFTTLLPVTTLIAVAQGPLSIATAVARRRRRFYALNVAALTGHAIGAVFAIGLALSGAGIWALIGLRVGIVVATTATLMRVLGLTLRPRWSRPIVRELHGFGKFILMSRLIENATLLAYNVAVGGLFGIDVLGYANMAMRLIEPVRGAMVAIVHNLSFSYFVPLVRQPARLAEETRRVSAESTVWIAPIFMGLAAISPTLVPLLAGPGWGEAVPISVALALGGMVALPSQVVISALSAVGRPEQSVNANVAGLAAMLLILAATIGLPPVAIGAARAGGDLVQTLITLLASGALIALPRRRLMTELARLWAGAGLMALAVATLASRLDGHVPAFVVLALAVAAGVALYALFLFVFARSSFEQLRPLLGGRAAPLVQQAAE